MDKILLKSVKQAKRLVVAAVGFTVLLIGIAMIVLPGPAIVMIPAGLAILATEFLWARRLLKKVKAKIQQEINAQGPHKEAGNNGAEHRK